MRVWLDIWRFEFYFGFHWYHYDVVWYRSIPRLFQVRVFDHCADITFYPLFLCFDISYDKRWNGKEGDEAKHYWI